MKIRSQSFELMCQAGSRVYQKHALTFMRTFGEACRTLASFGEPTTPYAQETPWHSLRVLAKVPYIHSSSSEGAFCMWVAVRRCPKCVFRDTTLRAQRLTKIKISLRDFTLQASHPPRPYFLEGHSEGRDWHFQARLKFFKRDFFFISSEIGFSMEKGHTPTGLKG